MTAEQVTNIINMLQSPDQENHVLALGVLETKNPNEITAILMMCYKFGNPKRDVWEINAPKSMIYMDRQAVVKPYSGFSFQQIFTLLTKPLAQKDILEIFFRKYSEYLSHTCELPGVEISIQLKDITNEPK